MREKPESDGCRVGKAQAFAAGGGFQQAEVVGIEKRPQGLPPGARLADKIFAFAPVIRYPVATVA
jgi:hypothetical protein